MKKKIINNNIYIYFVILIFVFIKFSTNDVFAKNYIVKNIEISEKYDLDFSKNKVIEKGFTKAFKHLITKLVQSKDQIFFNEIRINEIKTLIDNFSIMDEKFIDEKYEGKFSVEFNKVKIINYIQGKNILPSIPIETSVLILPILVNQNKSEIFYFNQNIFFEKWLTNKNSNYLLKYSLPNQDIEDYHLLKRNLDNLEDYNFREITDKYNFKNLVIIIINKNINKLKIFSKIKFYDQSFSFNNVFENINIKDEKSIEEVIEELKIIYDDKWKLLNIINKSISLPIILKVDSNRYLLTEKLEKTLKQLELVNTFTIEKINNKEIIYKIIYNGLPKKFLIEMQKNNLNLNFSNDIWTLG